MRNFHVLGWVIDGRVDFSVLRAVAHDAGVKVKTPIRMRAKIYVTTEIPSSKGDLAGDS